MEKTSREYAEKLTENHSNTFRPTFISGYLTAIEETNVKGLQEALEKARQDINWMLNNRQFLNAEQFDYIETTLKKSKEI